MSIVIDRSPQLVQYFGTTKDIASLTNISNVATIYRIQDGGYKVWDSANTEFASFDQLEEGVGYLIFSKSTSQLPYTIDAGDTSETLPQSTSVSDTIAIMRYSGDTVDLTVSDNITNYDQIFLVDENGDYKSWSKANITNNTSSFNAFNELTNNETYLIFSDSALTFPDNAYEFAIFIGDPSGILMYSVSPTTNSVKVIDSGNGVVVDTITVGRNPIDIVIDSTNGLAYVANQNSSNISVISLPTNKIIATIFLNDSGGSFAVTKIKIFDNKLYAISDTSNTIIIIDTATNSIIDKISLSADTTHSDVDAFFIDMDAGLGSIYTMDSATSKIYKIENKTMLAPLARVFGSSSSTNFFGKVISTNYSGDTIAAISGIASVNVYKLLNGRFIPLGFAITTTTPISDLMLSDNGNRLIISSISAKDSNEAIVGSVTVFEYDGTSWNKLAPTIFGSQAGEKLGSSCAISASGSVVAFSSPSYDNNKGKVSVYSWDGESWTQLGSDIIGSVEDEMLGTAIRLDSDGETLSIGSYSSNKVEVYSYNAQSLSWNPFGQTLEGLTSTDGFGWSIDLSSNGRLLVASSSMTDDIRAFQYDGSTGWEQIGNTINDRHTSVRINNDGTRILASNPSFDFEDFTNIGKLTVFQRNGSTWTKLDRTLYGITNNDRLGNSIDISRDGDIFFASMPGEDFDTDNIGSITAYTYSR